MIPGFRSCLYQLVRLAKVLLTILTPLPPEYMF